MKIDCSDIQGKLSDFLFEELSSSEAVTIKEHISTCQSCRDEFEYMQKMDKLVKERPALNDYAKTSAKIIAAINVSAKSQEKSKNIVIFGSAAAVVIVIISLGIIFYSSKALQPISVSAVYGDTKGWYGETKKQRAVVKNTGNKPSEETLLKVFISKSKSLDGSSKLVSRKIIPSLVPSETKVVDYDVEIPSDWEGQMVYVIAVVDGYDNDHSIEKKFQAIGMSKLDCDVNGDNKVDSTDLEIAIDVVKDYQLKWNSSVDVNKDGKINVTDIGFITDAIKASERPR